MKSRASFKSRVKASRGYTLGMSYDFFVGDHIERAIYLGKNDEGMHMFSLPGDQVWTGFQPPVGHPSLGQSRWSR